MVTVTFHKDGISLEGHCQNSKACISLTALFNLFIEVFKDQINLQTDLKKNYYKIITKNNEIKKLIQKYILYISETWTKNEIFLNNKDINQNQIQDFLKNNLKINL
jgi:hypothetical protein